MLLKYPLAYLCGVVLLAGTLSGCEGGFSLGGGDSAPPPAEETAPKPRKKRGRPAASTEDVLAPKAAASVAPTTAIKPKSFLYRNVSYDRVRTRAMTQVYEGQTKKAMSTFQSAQRIRPDDPAVAAWMSAIRTSAKKTREADPTAVDDFKAAAQQLRAPQAASVGGNPQAPVVGTTGGATAGAGGSAPSLPAPQAGATPAALDPSQIF